MRIVVTKPRDGKTDISIEHVGAVLTFRRRLKGVDVTKVREVLRPVLEEWEAARELVRASLG